MTAPGAPVAALAGGASVATLRRQVERLHDLPAPPLAVQRVVDALDRPDADLAEAAALIETDQVLTAQLLRLANSAFYSASGQIPTVLQALTVLGTVVARSLVYTTTVLDLRIDVTGFFEHSTGVAVASGAIARHLGLPRAEDVAGAGLLHDLGKVALFRQAPAAFAAVRELVRRDGCRFVEGERRLLGVDHTEIASWLLARWRLPPRLVEPVVWHHAPGRAPSAGVETAVVHVANTLVRAVGHGFGGDDRIPAIDTGAWALLGLRARDLDAILERFADDLQRVYANAATAGAA